MGVSGSRDAIPAVLLSDHNSWEHEWCSGRIKFEATAHPGNCPAGYHEVGARFLAEMLELGHVTVAAQVCCSSAPACDCASYAAHDARSLLATVAAHNAAVCGCRRGPICPQPPPVLASCADCRRHDVNDTARDPRQGFPTSGVQHGTMSASQGHPGSTPCSADLIITVIAHCADGYADNDVRDIIDLYIVPGVHDYVGSSGGPTRAYYCPADSGSAVSVAIVIPGAGGFALSLVGCAPEVSAVLTAFFQESGLAATLATDACGVIDVIAIGAHVRAADAGCLHRPAPPPTYPSAPTQSTATVAQPQATTATRVPPCKRVEWRGATDDLTANAASAAVLGAVEGGRWLVDGHLGYPATSAPGAPGRGTAGTVSVGVNPPQSGAQMSVTELMALSRLGAVLPYGSCTPSSSC